MSPWLCLQSKFLKYKYIPVKKNISLEKSLREKNISVICEYFANTSNLTNIIPIPICKFCNSQTIPIPICSEVGSANQFLILFAVKIPFFIWTFFTVNLNTYKHDFF